MVRKRLSIGVPEFAPYALSMRRKQGAGVRFLCPDQPPGRIDDFGKAAGELEVAEVIRCQPFEIVMLVVEHRLPGGPAGGKRHDQVVPAAARPRQHLAPAGQAHDLDPERGFFVDLAMQCRMQGFAEFDPPARQRIKPLGRRARAAHQQHPVVPEDRGTDGELWTLRRLSGHHGGQPAMMVSTSASAPPLMMAPASATSGLTHAVACSASVARVLSWCASRIAEPTAVRIEVMVDVMLSNSVRIVASAES